MKQVVLGVVGAGTMGSGIAQLGCAAGLHTVLHDPFDEALARGARAVGAGLEKWAEKGRAAPEASEFLEPAPALSGLAGCDLVIEAAPEQPQLKRELFGRLSEVCGEETVLATNTSSIPVTSLAGAAQRPENVVGMHFFNPPPLMRLLEVIRAEQTGDAALELACDVGHAMGKEVILASDGPGFLVNRCGRPFMAEALRLLQEGIAGHEEIDRICRMGGGFRMGPFELMDLVGVDVGFAVAQSFTELSFGEPRWKPSPTRAGRDGTLRSGGIPRPVWQFPAPWNPDERIDFAWPAWLAGVEKGRTPLAHEGRRLRAGLPPGQAVPASPVDLPQVHLVRFHQAARRGPGAGPSATRAAPSGSITRVLRVVSAAGQPKQPRVATF